MAQRRWNELLATVLLMLPVASAQAANYSCTTFAYLNKPSYITGLNNSGQSVGTVFDSSGNPQQGFLRNTDGSFNVILFPGSLWTAARTINSAGQIAGTFADASGVTHGFIRDGNGNYTKIDPAPGTGVGPVAVYGINDSRDLSASRGNQMFVVDAGGSIVNQVVSEAVVPAVGPVNNSREFAFLDLRGGGQDLKSDGTFVPSVFPGNTSYTNVYVTTPWALDNLGNTGGYWQPRNLNPSFPFLRFGDKYPSVSCPGFETDGLSNRTTVYAMNDKGVVAGAIQAGSAALSFIATPTGKAPQTLVSNTSWTFSSHPVGESSGPGTLYVTNTGNAPLHLPNIQTAPFSGPNADDFAVTGTTCAAAVGIGHTCKVTFVFTPQSAGSRTSALILADDSADAPHIIPVSGTGLAQALIFKPSSWQFSPHPVGETSGPGKIFVTNSSNRVVTISDIRFVGANPADFTITGSTCSAPLAINATCNVTFTFTPLAIGTRLAWLTFTDNGPISLQDVMVAGQGN
jgi:hypothetical protein